MKTILISLASVFALTGSLIAADTSGPVTVTGKALCAHCDLSIGDDCNQAIQTSDETVYLLEGPMVEPFFNANEKVEQVTATGSVNDKADHKVMQVSKIDKAG